MADKHKTPTCILGISAYYHDSAAALVKDGVIIAAAQEERFTRKKHDAGFPKHAVAYCLKEAGITIRDVTHVAFYDKPFLKLERLLLTYLSYAPFGLLSFLKSMPVWLKEKVFLKDTLMEALGWDGEIIFTEHHESHAASAFFPVAISGCRVPDHGRCRRVGHDEFRGRRGQPDQAAIRDPFPAFAGAAVFRIHVLLRVSREFRRVQADGTGALRRAEIRGSYPRKAYRYQG